MPGFKSKRAMSAGAFYAPYVPDLKPLNWHEFLSKKEAHCREKYGWGDSDNVKSDCMDDMQKYFPGKYSLEWKQTAPNRFNLQPVFKDPKHETMWKLKYEQ
jgi:hypothetical protein